jgi:hypothetical protein
MLEKNFRDKVVFICGPYTGESIFEVTANIERARTYAVKYWQLGYTVICPHLNTQFFDILTDIPEEAFLQGCLELVRRCDILVAIDGWLSSPGARQEIDLAISLSKGVLYDNSLDASKRTRTAMPTK